MTPNEQKQVEAATGFYERQLVALTREGANMAMLAEAQSQRIQALEAQAAELTTQVADLTARLAEKTKKPR